MATVLVAGDEEQVRVLAEGILQRGHRPLTAATVEEAMTPLGTVTVDLLLIDIELADRLHSGLELAEHATKVQPRIRALYTSAAALTDGMRALFGDVRTSGKPYAPDDLDNAIGGLSTRLIDRRGRVRMRVRGEMPAPAC